MADTDHPEMSPPAVEAFALTDPTTVEDLRVLVSMLFHCMRGPPRAYFEFPSDVIRGPEHLVTRVSYSTWGYTGPNQAAGCAALWGQFKVAYLQMAGHGYGYAPILFWRLSPEFVASESGGRVKVRCRLAIPGVDLTKFEAYQAEGGLFSAVGVTSAAQSTTEGSRGESKA
jgi:hypothetical protein